MLFLPNILNLFIAVFICEKYDLFSSETIVKLIGLSSVDLVIETNKMNIEYGVRALFGGKEYPWHIFRKSLRYLENCRKP